MAKGIYESIVVANRQIANDIYRISLEFSDRGAEAMANAKPGQFGELDLSNTSLPPTESIPEHLQHALQRKVLLRRPFSFADVHKKGSLIIVDIVYCTVGASSMRMTTLKTGDTLSVVGPLGNGFWMPPHKKTALLVVGGMGAPPLIFMAKYLNQNHQNIETIAFAGAKSRFHLPFEARLDGISEGIGFALGEFAAFGIESMVATDDGSAGCKGFVTECLEKWLHDNRRHARDVVIFACGPEAMLERVAALAEKKCIDCQVSMERRMGCGIGLCQSCAVECKTQDGQTAYKMCCSDGPVFDSKEVVFTA